MENSTVKSLLSLFAFICLFVLNTKEITSQEATDKEVNMAKNTESGLESSISDAEAAEDEDYGTEHITTADSIE